MTLRVNSKYPTDKVIYMLEGSYTQVGGDGLGTTAQTAHGLTFRPLMSGSWSTSPTFTDTHEMFTPIYNDLGNTYVEVYSNDTNITISGFKASAGNQTIYYRVYGLMPSDISNYAGYTSSVADAFVYNSKYNYSKLYYNELLPAAASTTITHNFGYRPQVMAWVNGGTIYGTGLINSDDTNYVRVSNTNVVVYHPAVDVHLRIYKDSQV